MGLEEKETNLKSNYQEKNGKAMEKKGCGYATNLKTNMLLQHKSLVNNTLVDQQMNNITNETRNTRTTLLTTNSSSKVL